MRRFAGLVVVAMLGAGDAALAQNVDPDYEERGPRFLLASAGAPVRVDLAKTPMLRRRISLELHGAGLGEALRQVSEKSGVRLAFSNAVLPPDRRVEFQANNITVAAALTELLIDAEVDVLFSRDGGAVLVQRRDGAVQTGTIVGRVTDAKAGQGLEGTEVLVDGTRWRTLTGTDGQYRLADVDTGTYVVTARRIGYTRQSRSVSVVEGQEVTADFALQAAVTRLDELVTTGTVVPTELKAIPTPISVITGNEIEQKGYQRVDQIFRGDVPAAIAWDLGGSGYYSDISIRGATSIFTNFVKTYIDGVEVANPKFLATLDPSSIERIEVLRGPQASTIYGSNASGGVMTIFTKRGAFNTPRPHLEAKLSAGLVQSRWNNAMQQDHSLAISGGATDFSYQLGGGYSGYGDWLPNIGSKNASLYGSMRGTQGPLTAEFSGRFYNKNNGYNRNPEFAVISPYVGSIDETDLVKQQTYGLTLRYAATPRWQHNLVLGYDRSQLEIYLNRPMLVTPADSFLSLYTNDESKASLAYNTTYAVSLGRVAQSSLTVGVDHWKYYSGGFSKQSTTTITNQIPSPDAGLRSEYDNTGFFGQVQLGFRDALFLTAGLRAEDNQNFGRDFGLAWNPRVGASYVRTIGDVSIKARAAYGKAIRPPSAGFAQAYTTVSSEQLANPDLRPEQQTGLDGGLDIYFGRKGSLEATYYHQTAIDLIDRFVVEVSPLHTFQFQNVGRIRNSGWELQGRFNAGQFSLTGTYSFTSSVVKQLSPTYSGDLRPGDQMRAIPRHMAGGYASYALPRTTASLGVTWIGSWVEWDWFALTTASFNGTFTGSFRDYWKTYNGFAKLNLSISQGLTDRVTLFLRSDNLTNKNVAERSNLNVNPGRVSMIGVRARF
jgi:outer membrane receptor protein involved in Fe transport